MTFAAPPRTGPGRELCSVGSYSDEYYLARHVSRAFRREVEHLLRLTRDNHHGALLEVGCGGGAFLHMGAKEGRNVVGLDSNLEALRLARRTAPSAAVVLGDAANLPFKDGVFSSVVAQHLIEHFDEPGAAVGEWTRVVAPGGTIGVATPNRAYADPAIYDDPTHRHIFSRSSLRDLLVRRRLSVERCYTLMPFLGTRRLTSILSSRFGVFRFLPFLADRGSTVVGQARKAHRIRSVRGQTEAAHVSRGRLRVAILIDELLKEGGGERQALYLARELQDMGHRVTVFALAHDPRRCYPEVSSRLEIVTAGRRALGRLPMPRRVRSYLDMRHLARQIGNGFDVLNPHASPAHWAAVEAARRLPQRPAVVWMCNDDLWSEGPVRWPWNPVRLPRLVLSALFRRYDQRLAKRVDALVVLDERMVAKTRRGYGIESLVVRSGVDVQQPAHPHSLASVRIKLHHQIPADRFLLLFVGILMPHRRLEDLLEAVSRLVVEGRPAHLLVVGSLRYDSAYARRLSTLTRSLGLEKCVTFADSVREADLSLYYSACDAFVFPNENQTWALAVTEAMANRKPVIVSTGCGIAQVLTDGENALLVPPRRPDLLALQIRRLIDDKGLADAIARAGYELVSETLSWRWYAENMVRVFEGASGVPAPVPPVGSAVAAGVAANPQGRA